jgi:hypothetical protein
MQRGGEKRKKDEKNKDEDGGVLPNKFFVFHVTSFPTIIPCLHEPSTYLTV